MAIGYALLVFLAVGITDFIWAQYIRDVTQTMRAGWAAMWSALLILTGSTLTVALISSSWYVIPGALGAAAGTWLSMRWR